MVDFVLSTNPPNPKTSFRLGDWICSSPKCAAHNFGRNLSCIGCGSQRSPSSPTNPPRPPISSPRFTNPVAPVPTPPPPPPSSYPSDPNIVLQKPSPHHPLLTPSGRAFAVGGKVQNISSDPLNPCIMFWPDNEPFPDQGQIRPSGLVGISQPPILNTGNRGPISHQPGDWVCQKCNYLNWRRRKVCQTCLPYAEGNGDSISAAVQAERIALLTNVLARTRLDPSGNFQVPIRPTAAHPPSFTPQHEQITPSIPAQRSHSLTPPVERTALGSAPPLLDVSSSLGPPSHATINLLRPNGAAAIAQSPTSNNRSVQRSQSHFTLGQQYQLQQQERLQAQIQRHLSPSPIYQTPLPSSGPTALGPELQHPSQQQHFQNQQLHQAQMLRNPSPLPMPLLYSTGPPASPFLGANLGMARTRVLSSPAAAAQKHWGVNAIADNTGSSSESASIPSLRSLDIPQVRVRRNDEEQSKAGDVGSQTEIDHITSGSELPTPAINTPLLPAFLRDVVSSPSRSRNEGESDEEKEVLSGGILVTSPTASEGDVSPEETVAGISKTPSPVPSTRPFSSRINTATFPLTTMPTATNPTPQVVPRTRNDSGSSTSSSSSSIISSTSSNVSTSGVSLSLSATSLSSESGCCGVGIEPNATFMSRPMRSTPVAGPSGPRSSSSSPTITRMTAEDGSPGSTAVAMSAATSSLPFMTLGGGGIWKMDGEESRCLKGLYDVHPPRSQFGIVGAPRVSKHGRHHHHHHHHYGGPELQAPFPLPVGAERRTC